MNHKINKLLLGAALAPLTGWADDDNCYEKFKNINPDDPSTVKQIIKEHFLPFFQKNYCSEGIIKIKEALGYFLSTDDSVDWQREYDRRLMPFDSPKNPKLFFVWLWEELSPNEEYQIYNLDGASVVENYDDYQIIFKRLDESVS
jgi:hypothetical protein